jgi:hypothetical protein
MVENRQFIRYECSRVVHTQIFFAGRRCGVRKALVKDISKGGLLLRFEEALPECDRVVVLNAGLTLSYRICNSYERDGAFFAGVQLSNEGQNA